MEEITIQPTSPTPSTSKEENKESNEMSNSTNSLPVVTLASDGSDSAVKVVQLSPLSRSKSLETLKKVKLKKVKSIPVSELLKLQINGQPFDGSKVGIFQVTQGDIPKIKNILVASNKSAGPVLEQAQKSNTASSTNTPVSSTTVSSTTDTNIPVNQVSENTKSIPLILQKMALLHNKTAGNQNTKTDLPTSDLKMAPKSNYIKECTSSTSHESNTTNKKEVQSKPKDSKADSSTAEMAKEKQPEKTQNEKSTSSKNKRKKACNEDKDSTKDETTVLYLAEGFREDVECLVEKCMQVSKLNFQKFTEIYQEMDFPCLFQ